MARYGPLQDKENPKHIFIAVSKYFSSRWKHSFQQPSLPLAEVAIEVERKDRQFFPILPESPSFLSADGFNRDGRPRYPISPGIGFTVLEECKDEFLERIRRQGVLLRKPVHLTTLRRRGENSQW
ncbi:hypothetical protein P5673_001062 [Acropora cervicornis]|uniref:Uncharacterized protein n=1 Tax=Acropora cervicornis TaxID=6130 RepID=A0AAD9R593_ACRCE|nr:hypothetical protein P5673_001062 [Acropora cervicornis]